MNELVILNNSSESLCLCYCHCVAGPWLKKQPQFDQLEKSSEMQSNTDYVHIEKVPKIDRSQPSLSADCWTVKIQIQIRASSRSWNYNFHTKKYERTLGCSYYAALSTTDADALLGKCQQKLCVVDIFQWRAWVYYSRILERRLQKNFRSQNVPFLGKFHKKNPNPSSWW